MTGETHDVGDWANGSRSETHVFTVSSGCASNGIGYRSIRCWAGVTGCDDQTCTCNCHDGDKK